jgi:hypothetical protein
VLDLDAKRRQLATLKQGDEIPVVENFTQRESEKVRDQLAASVGVSGQRGAWAREEMKTISTH